MTDAAILYASGKGHQIDIKTDDDGIYLTARANTLDTCLFAPHDSTGELLSILRSIADQVGI